MPSRASSGACRVPRPFPTRIIVRDDTLTDVWRSPEMMLGEHLRAAELLARDTAQRFGIPQEFADMLQVSTHELFVLDSTSGELLQIPNLATTRLQSLQRFAGPEGNLTIIIQPIEDSENAFDIIPCQGK